MLAGGLLAFPVQATMTQVVAGAYPPLWGVVVQGEGLAPRGPFSALSTIWPVTLSVLYDPLLGGWNGVVSGAGLAPANGALVWNAIGKYWSGTFLLTENAGGPGVWSVFFLWQPFAYCSAALVRAPLDEVDLLHGWKWSWTQPLVMLQDSTGYESSHGSALFQKDHARPCTRKLGTAPGPRCADQTLQWVW